MVASYTQLLAKRYKGKLDNDADEFIAFAVNGANRMQALIQDLLAFSRVDTQGQHFEATSVETLLGYALDNLKGGIEESGAVVTHDPLPTVMADERQLLHLLQNLLSNAIKFRGQDPPLVHISAEKRDNQWQFSIRDNGIGIDPQYAERIFVIFQRFIRMLNIPVLVLDCRSAKRLWSATAGAFGWNLSWARARHFTSRCRSETWRHDGTGERRGRA